MALTLFSGFQRPSISLLVGGLCTCIRLCKGLELGRAGLVHVTPNQYHVIMSETVTEA